MPSSFLTAGSPPRAWGQLSPHWHIPGNVRFTPTRVGTILKKTCIYGTRTRKRPSKSSTDRAVFPQLRIRYPCSLSLEWINTQPPSLACPHAFSQRQSRTRADTLPTKTPAFGSRYHRVNSPRNPGGTRSRIITTMIGLRFVGCERIDTSAFHFPLHRVP